MKTVLVAGGVFTGVWELVTQLPANVLLAVVFLVAVVVLVVLFHEPACERLIRIIKALTEVRHPKER